MPSIDPRSEGVQYDSAPARIVHSVIVDSTQDLPHGWFQKGNTLMG